MKKPLLTSTDGQFGSHPQWQNDKQSELTQSIQIRYAAKIVTISRSEVDLVMSILAEILPAIAKAEEEAEAAAE